jgi:alpha-1,2-mannosyltransferase
MAKIVGHVEEPIFCYYYSAFFALLLSPVSVLPSSQAVFFWGLLQLALLVALYVAAFYIKRDVSPLLAAIYTVIFFTSFPLLHNTKWGQVSVLLVLFIIFACYFAERDRSILAGVIIGLASAIKHYPALFLLYFLMRGNYKAAVSGGLAILVFYALIPIGFFGVEQWLSFELAVFNNAISVSWISADSNSQYFAHVLTRWLGFANAAEVSKWSSVIQWFGNFLVMMNVILLFYMHRREKITDFTIPLVLLFLSLPFFIKTSWPHYFVYLPFCQIIVTRWLGDFKSENRALQTLFLLFLILSVFCSSFFAFKLFPDWRTYNKFGLVFLANLSLLVCVYLAMARGLRKH